jgi:DNA-binding IclR family transcriptional regulator
LSSAQRLIEVLALFTLKRPAWTPLAAAHALGLSRASVYRYFLVLNESGYIIEVAGHQYALGPRIVELDRQIRLGDSLVQVAVDEMVKLAKETGGVALLCRLYNQRVLCIHQERGTRLPGFVSYERGRAMPLYRGATSKVILAFLPADELEVLVERDRGEVAGARLPRDGAALRELLGPIRDERICIAYREVDPDACGVAVPICDSSQVIGSLSIVLPAIEAKGRMLKTACRLLVQAGVRIEADVEHAEAKRRRRKNGL